MSVPPPGAAGTTTLTARWGYCAKALVHAASVATTARNVRRNCIRTCPLDSWCDDLNKPDVASLFRDPGRSQRRREFPGIARDPIGKRRRRTADRGRPEVAQALRYRRRPHDRGDRTAQPVDDRLRRAGRRKNRVPRRDLEI